MSTAYHLSNDGQSEHTMKTLEDMHSACTNDFEGNWDTHLPLVEFPYNNSYHPSVNCAPFEALYGRRCRLGKASKLSLRYVGPFEVVERVGPGAYRLRLPQELIDIHDIFHVSNKRNAWPKTYLGTRRRDEAQVSANVRERYGLRRATETLGRNSL
nr:uncharacterized protein [Tanacetum cinerariifolium]GEW40089.1 uncharacterized protein [Tanacetum cinerariifolium]GEW40092.1 uncharacterized protein [Tanacetum cinerariifolium]